jgi:hypothetical protein
MDNIIEAAKGKISEITDNVSGRLKHDVIDAMSENGLDKLNEVWAQIDSSTEILKQTGYNVTGINVNLGMPPAITMNLDQIENINDEQEEKLLEENKDKTFLYPILVSLFKANAFQRSIKTERYKFSGITIGFGIPPSIDLKFKTV